MAKNRYFIGHLPQSDMAKVYEVIVGHPFKQITNKQGNIVGVKLPLGDTATHQCLNSFTEYSYDEYLTIIRGWETEIK